MECKGLQNPLWPNRHDNCMPCIIPACAARADVYIRRKDVNQLSFTLVPPSRAQHSGHCSVKGPSSGMVEIRSKLRQTAHGPWWLTIVC